MHLVEVDVVGLQAAETVLARLADVVGREPTVMGPVPMGWYTLVASTTWSRRPDLASHRPMISSDRP
jgi:hypothetical protein